MVLNNSHINWRLLYLPLAIEFEGTAAAAISAHQRCGFFPVRKVLAVVWTL